MWPDPEQCGRSWGGNWGSPGLCVTSPRLCQTVLFWQLEWLLPCLGGTVERGRRCTVGHREAGCGQAQHLPRSSLWGPCLGKLMVFGSVLQSRDPAVNSIKAVLGKGGINYPDEKDE